MEALFPVILVVVIAELIVSGTWQKFYFTTGIPVFKKAVRLSESPELSSDVLNDRFSGGFWGPLCFKPMSSNQIAFREAIFCFHLMNYTPVMHGLIRYDERMKELQVIGFVNWFAPLFILCFIAMASSLPSSEEGIDIMFTVFPIGLFASLYFIQFSRFSRVYKALSLQNSWQRKD
ncbi:MAG: hypothetical protein PF692_13915 [Kiritimatiellae bacterium]|nr:hypothetical protein [Kiritimatiellia bacterium]